MTVTIGRKVFIVSVGVLVAVVFATKPWPLSPRTAPVTRATAIIDSDGRDLRSLFEGAPEDPRADPALITAMSRPVG